MQYSQNEYNSMDTESIRLFVLAAEKLNISAAGKALAMAPSVASTKLAKLENALGADLLHRSTRQVSLSLEGAEFLPYAREMLAQENAAFAALGKGSNVVTGMLRFTAPSTFAQIYIAPLLPEFLARHPGIRLDLRLTDIQMSLIEGSYDLALRNSAPEDSSLKGRLLANDTRILCAAPSYLEKHGAPVKTNELNDHQLIAFRDVTTKSLVGDDGSRGEFNAAKSKGRLIVDDGLSQKLATVAGAGISINSLWNVHEEIKNGTLVRVLPNFTVDEKTGLWLLYPRTNVLTPKVRVMIDFLCEKLAKLPS